MHKFDEFIHKESAPLLPAGEEIELTGFFFTQPLGQVIRTEGLILKGEGYFLAALTRRRLILIAAEMGLATLKMENKGLREIPLAEIRSIKTGGFLNQKRVAFELKSGETFTLQLNTLATLYASGQKNFIAALTRFHQSAL